MEELLAGMGQAIPGVVGSLLQNQFTRGMVSSQNDFSRDMANSAHQREVGDLRAAGLNPILSAGGGGAPAPVGGTGPMQNPFANVAQVMQANRQIDQADQQLEIARQNADISQQNADATTKNAESAAMKAEQDVKAQKYVNDSIESVLPYFKKGLKTIHDVPEALMKSMFEHLGNAFYPTTQLKDKP